MAQPVITESEVDTRIRFFRSVGLWPTRDVRLDHREWLSNFKSSEKGLAVNLLASFYYFKGEVVERLFEAAFNRLAALVLKGVEVSLRQQEWNLFCRTVRIVRVLGGQKTESDSAYLFTRMARHLPGVSEEQIMAPDSALLALQREPSRSVLFVDDFVGSGIQFCQSWNLLHQIADRGVSFAELAIRHPGTRYYFAPVICTAYGKRTIAEKCAPVSVVPAHLLNERYNALHPESLIWPSELRLQAIDFIHNASQRAGIPDTDGGVHDWRGFHKLGLTVAFEHGIPDATLPLFYWNENGWKPLMRQS